MKATSSRRGFVAVALWLAVSCSSNGADAPDQGMSKRCREMVTAFDTAKSKWEAAKGTSREDALLKAFQEMQDRLFRSGCLAS